MEEDYRPGPFSISSMRGTLFMGACVGLVVALIVGWLGGNREAGFWASSVPASVAILGLKIRSAKKREDQQTSEAVRRDPPTPRT
jgi:hypothetical protein